MPNGLPYNSLLPLSANRPLSPANATAEAVSAPATDKGGFHGVMKKLTMPLPDGQGRINPPSTLPPEAKGAALASGEQTGTSMLGGGSPHQGDFSTLALDGDLALVEGDDRAQAMLLRQNTIGQRDRLLGEQRGVAVQLSQLSDTAGLPILTPVVGDGADRKSVPLGLEQVAFTSALTEQSPAIDSPSLHALATEATSPQESVALEGEALAQNLPLLEIVNTRLVDDHAALAVAARPQTLPLSAAAKALGKGPSGLAATSEGQKIGAQLNPLASTEAISHGAAAKINTGFSHSTDGKSLLTPATKNLATKNPAAMSPTTALSLSTNNGASGTGNLPIAPLLASLAGGTATELPGADLEPPISKIDSRESLLTATGLLSPSPMDSRTVNGRVHIPVDMHFSHQQWPMAMAEKAAQLVSQNITSAELQLDPPELGPLQVRIQVHQDQATVNFVSANPQVREALDLSLMKLREMLQEQGLQLVDSGVSDQRQGRESEGGAEDQPEWGAPLTGDGGDENVVSSEIMTPWGIDHFV